LHVDGFTVSYRSGEFIVFEPVQEFSFGESEIGDVLFDDELGYDVNVIAECERPVEVTACEMVMSTFLSVALASELSENFPPLFGCDIAKALSQYQANAGSETVS
jgi:hypothetical protein